MGNNCNCTCNNTAEGTVNPEFTTTNFKAARSEIKKNNEGLSRPTESTVTFPLKIFFLKISYYEIPASIAHLTVEMNKLTQKAYNTLKTLPKFPHKPSKNLQGPFLFIIDESTYKGEIEKTTKMREGFGEQVTSNGEMYEGYWKNDKREGIGRYIFENGNYYEGQFSNNFITGKGIFFDMEKGNIYEGDLFEGKKHGHGKEIHPNGATIEGEFKNGVFEGKGKWEKDGDFYEGYFKFGNFDGLGKLKSKNGDFREGSFKGGKLEGKGVEILKERGERYVGEFSKGRREGEGVLYMYNFSIF